MNGSRRQGALLLWITLALVSAAATWLGLVGFALILSRPGLGTREDWLISGSVFSAGLAALLGSIWMGRRAYLRRR